MKLNVKKINDGIFHITTENAAHLSLLSKYSILNENPKSDARNVLYKNTSADVAEKKAVFSYEGKIMEIITSEAKKGYNIHIPVDEKTRFFGLGDSSRESIERRGEKIDLWIKNVTGYGPIPFMVTSDGWGIFINSTYKITCDIDSENKGYVEFYVRGGEPDFFVFLAPSMKTIINLYTDITGKPVIMPKSSYGFTFVCNEEEDARALVEDTAAFRKNKVPCDIMSLEPEWMSERYDFTTKKTWSKERFYLPIWQPENYSGHHSFFFNLREMGMKLSLWLCCDYDILWEEEKTRLDSKEYGFYDADIRDENLGYDTMMDKLTVPGEPWFKHLEKFVEQGVFAFKMDGANHVLEHPDRLWAGTYKDEEVHNVYPVILAKQMKEGFQKKTGNRAMIFLPGVYAGTQKYAASWSGDTGGTQKTLVSVINHAMSGHTNTTCDMNMTDPHSIHYASLVTWTKGYAWCNWHYPWLLGDRLFGIMQYYNTLRSTLFPYIYSYAHEASKSGMPVARPLPLVYEDTDKYDNTSNMYMLGDYLLVGAFDMHMDLPDGKWTDYFTTKTYEGAFEYEIPEGKGGALFVKSGALIVTQPPMLHLDEKLPEIYNIDCYPGKEAHFSLIEDDGTTYAYEDGLYCQTDIHMDEFDGKKITLKIGKRKGEFDGMPSLTDLCITVHTDAKPKEITVNNNPVNFKYHDKNATAVFTLKSSLRNNDVICKINI